ncbi:MAG: hypothetical protein P1U57_13165 [Oleibacter sp.]|nr:hypothetical protein [Thalassolituus sp.]
MNLQNSVSATLKRRRRWLGWLVSSEEVEAQITELSQSHVTFISSKRWRVGAKLWLSLEGCNHRLNRIPVEVVFCEDHKKGYRCSVNLHIVDSDSSYPLINRLVLAFTNTEAA